ncbi:MAG TPA: histidine--tRNA ligase [Candidatus Gastranaerophilales bacterium]|nr:histidine--tRNA ligase [Candidatus Gastranaerophilales bacterium]
MNYKAPKGTKDILPSESHIWQYIEKKAQKTFENANYKEIRTPIFESTELFTRGVGDSTDIVNKEMYTFTQKDRSLTLRPENTAGVVRAFIEHGMNRLSTPLKLWYKGAMFRYERPQAGRQRQFHQLGVELFGIEGPSADAEVIQLAMNFLKDLELNNLCLEINNIGCPACRDEYKNKLKAVIQPKLEEFCEDCHIRFEKNPLRILDCKNEKCRELLSSEEIETVINQDFICEECVKHFEELKKYLETLNVDYKINKKLVRGLDYYNRTVFEITSSDLGSQNAVCGGGRYDPLVKTLGGEYTPAIGWAIGMERLVSLYKSKQENPLDIFIVSSCAKEALNLAFKLRKANISADLDFSARKFAKQIEKASKIGAKYVLILGEDELNSGILTLKNLSTGQQSKVSLDQIFEMF